MMTLKPPYFKLLAILSRRHMFHQPLLGIPHSKTRQTYPIGRELTRELFYHLQ